MIKLQDFARECGVTDRAIQKHLKTYADELDGLYERKGPNGTWLSDQACEILRSKMRQMPVVVGDSETQRMVEELREENRAVLKALNAAKDKIIEMQGAQARLEAAEKETTMLTGLLQDRNAEIRTLTEEKAQEAARAKEADRRAEQAERREQEAQNRADRAEAERNAEKARNEALMRRGVLARLINREVD